MSRHRVSLEGFVDLLRSAEHLPGAPGNSVSFTLAAETRDALVRALEALLAGTPETVIIERPRQYDCQREPPFPDHETVVSSIRYPELTSHLATARCPIEGPHEIRECGEWSGGA